MMTMMGQRKTQIGKLSSSLLLSMVHATRRRRFSNVICTSIHPNPRPPFRIVVHLQTCSVSVFHNMSPATDEPNGEAMIEATILSLDEWKVPIHDDVATVLAESGDEIDAVLANMKRPPGETTCRIVGGVVPMDPDPGSSATNRLEEAMATIRRTLQPWLVARTIMDNEVTIALHPVLQDVVTIRIDPDPTVRRTKTSLVSSHLRRPADDSSQSGWPIDYKVIIVDRLTGEAILRGSHVYVRGVQAASSTVHVNERVAVYAAVVINEDHCPILLRGLQVSQYTGTCIFCGIGTAKKSRGDMFTHQSGLAVEMIDSVGSALLPPKSALMEIENNESSNYHHDHNKNATTIMLQNLPSCLVATALASTVTPGQVVLDMCACPGGKTSHLASFLLDKKGCHIVACDRSRKKIQAAQDLFRRHGLADMITCLALDSRKAVLQPTQDGDVAQDDFFASMSLSQVRYNIELATVPSVFSHNARRHCHLSPRSCSVVRA
jgi:predicted ribosome-associated RNA-binding protein Tma20